MPTYKKLVRDRIPEIIENSGKAFTVETLDEKGYIKELKQKLNEEILEYLNSQEDTEALEELADVIEVIYALSHVHHADPERLEEIRKEKAKKRGGFCDRIFLVEVGDE